jgi:hypothetical protein
MGSVSRIADLVVVHDGGCGVDRAFSMAARELGVGADYHAVDVAHPGDSRFQRRDLLRPGAGLCLSFDRSTLDERTTDLARQSILAAGPTYLIDAGWKAWPT